MSTSWNELHIEWNKAAKVRRESLHGRSYLVAPSTLIVPGVLNGSSGPILYTVEENARSVDSWNGMPIVVYHPSRNGLPVSARDPEILQHHAVGQVLRAKIGKKTGALVAEAWFDEERVKRVDNRIYTALEANEPIELSTGLYLEYEPVVTNADGSLPQHEGHAYQYVARNYRPDHLAVLPDEIGACSREDGCGILVTTNTLSHEDVRTGLEKALCGLYTQAEPPCWIVEVFDTYCIYYHDGELYRISYRKGGEEVTLSGSPTRVVRQSMYVAAPSNDSDMGEMKMPMTENERKGIITLLTTNCDCWKEATDAEVLNGMTDGKLLALKKAFDESQKKTAVLNTTRATLGLSENATVEEVVTALGTVTNRGTNPPPSSASPVLASSTAAFPVVNGTSEPPSLTREQWWHMAPAEDREYLQMAMASAAREKEALVGRLTANMADGPAKQAALTRFQAMATPVLMDLVAAMPTPVPARNGWGNLTPSPTPYPPAPASTPAPIVNYQGAAGGPPSSVQSDDKDLLLIPIWNKAFGAEASSESGSDRRKKA